MTTPAATRRQPRMPIEVRREQVLDAAMELIGEQGYSAATMEAIARRAGLAKPVVYNAYGGRGELLDALLVREEARALGALADAAADAPDAADATQALLTWLRTLAHAIAASPAPWRLMLAPAAETPDLVQERVARGRAVALAQAEALIEGVLAGRPTPVDRRLAAHLLLAAAEQAARLMLDDPDAFPPERLVAFAEGALIDVFRSSR